MWARQTIGTLEPASQVGPARNNQSPAEGQEVSRITGTKLTKKTALGKMLVGLKGGPIEPGEEVDPTQFVGREYLLVVGETDNGSTRVETVLSNPGG